ncbi:hypothetical protein BC936DRAFT_144150 [Jimgerdemannia flammicorona]|uniref:PRP28/DDX23-like helical domain-containing protein n=1 Tax=Jimgerdemannia flammicorona TaxID=994334 RepID=A0A433DD07_9FUNG|nr:hypothetical protein BC936DRAFT_144150 [Jimgerdemannia flammicorona]
MKVIEEGATRETAMIASNTLNVISAVRGITPAVMELDDDKEVQVIRERHVDGERHKHKIRKMNEKVMFDWATDEDMSYDFNPLYANQHDAQMTRSNSGWLSTTACSRSLGPWRRTVEKDHAEELMDIDCKDTVG